MTAPRTAQSTNQGYRFLLSHGSTGLSTDFEHPTLTGCDSGHELAKIEAGKPRAAARTLD